MSVQNERLGTVHDDGEWLRLRYDRKLTHPVAEVWRMLTEPDGLAAWFPRLSRGRPGSSPSNSVSS